AHDRAVDDLPAVGHTFALEAAPLRDGVAVEQQPPPGRLFGGREGVDRRCWGVARRSWGRRFGAALVRAARDYSAQGGAGQGERAPTLFTSHRVSSGRVDLTCQNDDAAASPRGRVLLDGEVE